MRRLFLAAAILISATTALNGLAKAEEAALFQCIKQYKSLGISPDAALAECNKKTVAECIKQLLGQKYVVTALEKGPRGYLIDLGNNEDRWLEGGPWKRLG